MKMHGRENYIRVRCKQILSLVFLFVCVIYFPNTLGYSQEEDNPYIEHLERESTAHTDEFHITRDRAEEIMEEKKEETIKLKEHQKKDFVETREEQKKDFVKTREEIGKNYNVIQK